MLLIPRLWLIVRFPFFWKLWMAYLYKRYRKSSWNASWNDANIAWDYHNRKYPANIRFTPLQIYNLELYADTHDEFEDIDIFEQS